MVASYLEVAAWMLTGAFRALTASCALPQNTTSTHASLSVSPGCLIVRRDAVPAGVRISNRLLQKYLRSSLQQEVAFYDTEATTGVLLQVCSAMLLSVLAQVATSECSLF